MQSSPQARSCGVTSWQGCVERESWLYCSVAPVRRRTKHEQACNKSDLTCNLKLLISLREKSVLLLIKVINVFVTTVSRYEQKHHCRSEQGQDLRQP